INLAIVGVAERAELGATHQGEAGILQDERRLVTIGGDHREATGSQIHNDINDSLFAGTDLNGLCRSSSILPTWRLRLHQLVRTSRDVCHRYNAIRRTPIALR